MKLILSRKGFDSSNGRCPSPIFPDGTLCSLPIPEDEADSTSAIAYGDLWHGDTNIGELVTDLTRRRQRRKRIDSKCHAHLDPDISHSTYAPREKDWHPLFGQTKTAQSHLCNQCAQAGDLFLFFGLFREVKKTDNGWCFVRGTKPRHILWGWLQIGEIHKVDEIPKEALPWARYHPHLQYPKPYPSNTLYVASDKLDLDHSFKGAGRFPKLHPGMVLTQPGKSASYWQLPRCFYPDEGKCPLTYFPDRNNNWNKDDNYAYAHRRGPGQEFVLDLDQYPGVTDWLAGTIFTCD